MQKREQGIFLEKSVIEKMKGITLILMQKNSPYLVRAETCFVAQKFHSGYTSKLSCVMYQARDAEDTTS